MRRLKPVPDPDAPCALLLRPCRSESSNSALAWLLFATGALLTLISLTPMAWHTTRLGRVDRWVVERHLADSNGLFRIGQFLSLFGSAIVITIVTAGLGWYLWRRQQRAWWAIGTTLGISGTAAGAWLAKRVVARPRPVTAVLSGESGYGFPSGHTTAAAALAVTLIALLLVGPLSSKWTLKARRIMASSAALMATGVALGRILVGAHFLTDTVAGLALGASGAGLGCAAVIIGELRCTSTTILPTDQAAARSGATRRRGITVWTHGPLLGKHRRSRRF